MRMSHVYSTNLFKNSYLGLCHTLVTLWYLAPSNKEEGELLPVCFSTVYLAEIKTNSRINEDVGVEFGIFCEAGHKFLPFTCGHYLCVSSNYFCHYFPSLKSLTPRKDH